MTPEDPEENTPLPHNNVIPIHREFVIDASERLTKSEQRLYNLSDDVNRIVNVTLPVMDRKLDRILDGQRELNKHIMNQPKYNVKAIWAGLVFAYTILGYLIFR